MKPVYLLLLVVTVVLAAKRYNPNGTEVIDLNNSLQLFEDFIKKYNRHYKCPFDKWIHYQAFYKNLVDINRWNAEVPAGGGRFEIGSFSDYTEAEQEQLHGYNPAKTLS
ncbi:uncharacterized protein LOC134674385 [Cydia fagiglandana]|uniref:uncharacterized protein LOC134674385 n=1 Tax=Cydia fagiglandana TaxID=1458189 RepID=UPI002FEE370E